MTTLKPTTAELLRALCDLPRLEAACRRTIAAMNRRGEPVITPDMVATEAASRTRTLRHVAPADWQHVARDVLARKYRGAA